MVFESEKLLADLKVTSRGFWSVVLMVGIYADSKEEKLDF